MLLPVDASSDNSKKPCSSPLKMMMSSANRLRCDHRQRAGVQESGGEVAIGRRVDAVNHHPRKSERRRQGGRVDGVIGARNRTRSERKRVGFRRSRSQSGVVATQRRGVREKEMRHQHGLCAPQVCIGRHQRRARCAGEREEGLENVEHLALERANPAAQVRGADPEKPVRSSSVRCGAVVRDPQSFDELPFYERVHVLVWTRDPRGIGRATRRGFPSARR